MKDNVGSETGKRPGPYFLNVDQVFLKDSEFLERKVRERHYLYVLEIGDRTKPGPVQIDEWKGIVERDLITEGRTGV